MKVKYIFSSITIIITLFCFEGCKKRNRTPEATILGTITVDLNANNYIVRKKEALIGNLICDALYKSLTSKGKLIDGALVNGGNIRFNAEKRPNGIYPAGPFTDIMVTEMMPFGNEIVIVKVSGRQLKEIFERSLANYPVGKGPFLQMSKGFKITIDTTKNPQLINPEETEIITSGNRITSIYVNNTTIDSNLVYTIMLPDFIADGNDGYVTLKNLSKNNKEYISDDMANALKELLLNDGILTPTIDNRIIFD